MIEINISELEEESRNYINQLTDNRGQEMRLEMIKFLKESYYSDCHEYAAILEFINDFFVFQPERSKREDIN